MKQRKNLEDLTGKVYGRLTVLEETDRIRYKNGKTARRWLVKCLCDTVKIVNGHSLKGGNTKSCGCLSRDSARKMAKLNNRVGDKSPNWKGGRFTTKRGYVLIYRPSHPKSYSSGYISEHTLVMEEKIGRHLLLKESVHHKDGARDNNDPDNLELWSTAQPAGQRVSDKLKWAKEIIKLYEKMEI